MEWGAASRRLPGVNTRSTDAGFTLIEVMVALALAGLAVLAAHRLFAGVVDGVQRLAEARRTLDREANARALLSHLITGADVDQGHPFQGQPQQVAFTAWCTDRVGRAVRKRLRVRAEGGALVLYGLYAEPVHLADSVTAVGFDYLLQLGAGERFVREWYSGASAPAALRLRLTRGATTDTLLLLVGSRG